MSARLLFLGQRQQAKTGGQVAAPQPPALGLHCRQEHTIDRWRRHRHIRLSPLFVLRQAEQDSRGQQDQADAGEAANPKASSNELGPELGGLITVPDM